MWPFDKRSTNKLLDQAVERLRAMQNPPELSKFEESLLKLNKRLDAIEMEWQEWFDKFRRLYARLAKRQEREEANEPVETVTRPQAVENIEPIPRNHARRNY